MCAAGRCFLAVKVLLYLLYLLYCTYCTYFTAAVLLTASNLVGVNLKKNQKGPELFRKYVGDSEKAVAAVFRKVL